MRLIDLDIQRMPGFEKEGFAYTDLAGGIHIICGPNGSGKTTTCRAIRSLLWPCEEKEIFPLLVHSHWECMGEKLFVAREGSKHIIAEQLSEKTFHSSNAFLFFCLGRLVQSTREGISQNGG